MQTNNMFSAYVASSLMDKTEIPRAQNVALRRYNVAIRSTCRHALGPQLRLPTRRVLKLAPVKTSLRVTATTAALRSSVHRKWNGK